ncbi:hypothetical protein [Pontiella agarivorans]|uniref:Uncharacterized protein n=1 Tax=Pontiella agarivorans TaxID=3038953 RepID=A0ABU5N131_9BACT|nr:hypothetical protein [Pontiella agarivorans]MDZ8119951.1 hypothetical protein [Pontiella agarivorans]
MNTKILMERETERNLSDALARGALLWAPLYSVGAAAVSYMLTAENPSTATPFSEVLMKALLLLSPVCMAAEAAGWAVFSKRKRLKRLGDRKDPLPKLVHFVPPLEARKVRTKHAA